jgi:enoyl-CoA hydratase/carnithine racemase
MNRPQNFNALSEEMLDALQQALDEVAKDDDARAVVLGATGKAFCPGHNLKEMVATPELAYLPAPVCPVQPHDAEHPEAAGAGHCPRAGHSHGGGLPAGGAVRSGGGVHRRAALRSAA